MSLISIKNVIEPFTNKVHLVSIIVVTMTFGIYRASGGTIEVSDRQQERNNQNRKVNVFQQSKPAKKAPINFGKSNTAQQQAPSQVSLEDDNFLDSMLGSNAPSAAKQQAAPAAGITNNQDSSTNNQQAQGGLEDIEKSLGLK